MSTGFRPVVDRYVVSCVNAPLSLNGRCNWSIWTGDPIVSAGQDLIKMHARAVQARKGHEHIETSEFRRKGSWRNQAGGVDWMRMGSSPLQEVPRANKSLPASLRPLVQELRGMDTPLTSPLQSLCDPRRPLISASPWSGNASFVK